MTRPRLLLLALLTLPALVVADHADARRNAHRTRKNAPVYRVSFYCDRCPDGGGRRVAWKRGRWNASGVAMHGVRFGSRVRIDGYPQTFVVDDRGGLIGPGRIDVRRHTRRCSCSRLGIQHKRAEVR